MKVEITAEMLFWITLDCTGNPNKMSVSRKSQEGFITFPSEKVKVVFHSAEKYVWFVWYREIWSMSKGLAQWDVLRQTNVVMPQRKASAIY